MGLDALYDFPEWNGPEMIANARIYNPAYVNMELYSDGTGAFSLDNKSGWAWYGDDGAFLLGLLRVADSDVWHKFKKEVKKENIPKEYVKKAILNSIKKNPRDGLYHLIGDNAAYLGFGITDEWVGIECELSNCLKDKGVKNAEDVADEIVGEATYHQPSTDRVFKEIENTSEKDMGKYTHKKGSWKHVVEEVVEKCDTLHDEAPDFMECVVDELEPVKEDLHDAFREKFDAGVYNALKSLSDNELEEISSKTGADLNAIKECVAYV